jgi:hypothetical protein
MSNSEFPAENNSSVLDQIAQRIRDWPALKRELAELKDTRRFTGESMTWSEAIQRIDEADLIALKFRPNLDVPIHTLLARVAESPNVIPKRAQPGPTGSTAANLEPASTDSGHQRLTGPEAAELNSTRREAVELGDALDLPPPKSPVPPDPTAQPGPTGSAAANLEPASTDSGHQHLTGPQAEQAPTPRANGAPEEAAGMAGVVAASDEQRQSAPEQPLVETSSAQRDITPRQRLCLDYSDRAYPNGWEDVSTAEIMKKAGDLIKADGFEIPKRDVWLRALERRKK